MSNDSCVNQRSFRGQNAFISLPSPSPNGLFGQAASGVDESEATVFLRSLPCSCRRVRQKPWLPILLTCLAADGKTIYTSKQRYKPIRLIGSENRFFVPEWNDLRRMPEGNAGTHDF
jgi:hypothetical protein